LKLQKNKKGSGKIKVDIYADYLHENQGLDNEEISIKHYNMVNMDELDFNADVEPLIQELAQKWY